MIKKITVLAVIGIILAACGAVNQSQSLPPPAPMGGDEVILDGIVNVAQEDQTPALEPVQTRIVLKNASLTLVVNDATESLNQVTELAENSGGWVVTSNTNKVRTSGGEEVTQGTITVRVPSESLTDTLNQIKAGAISVESESVTGQDVTQDYVDLTSQLGNLKAAEAQLQTIMDGARNTEDVLAIYNELVRVRGEIDTTQGRIRYYDESAAYSSISINLIPEAIDTPIQIAGWTPGKTAESALATLINILRFAADLLITIAILVLPLVLIFGVPGWFIYRTLLRKGIIIPRTTPKLVSQDANPQSPEE
jgi:hypothetical protein